MCCNEVNSKDMTLLKVDDAVFWRSVNLRGQSLYRSLVSSVAEKMAAGIMARRTFCESLFSFFKSMKMFLPILLGVLSLKVSHRSCWISRVNDLSKCSPLLSSSLCNSRPIHTGGWPPLCLEDSRTKALWQRPDEPNTGCSWRGSMLRDLIY